MMRVKGVAGSADVKTFEKLIRQATYRPLLPLEVRLAKPKSMSNSALANRL